MCENLQKIAVCCLHLQIYESANVIDESANVIFCGGHVS